MAVTGEGFSSDRLLARIVILRGNFSTGVLVRSCGQCRETIADWQIWSVICSCARDAELRTPVVWLQ